MRRLQSGRKGAKEMTRREAARLVAWAAANFPGMQEKDLSPTAEVWLSVLNEKGVDLRLAEAALKRVLEVAVHFPTVAEILRAVEEIRQSRHQLPAARIRVKCPHCRDGIIIAKKQVGKRVYEFAYRCNCRMGMERPEQAIPAIPGWMLEEQPQREEGEVRPEDKERVLEYASGSLFSGGGGDAGLAGGSGGTSGGGGDGVDSAGEPAPAEPA